MGLLVKRVCTNGNDRTYVPLLGYDYFKLHSQKLATSTVTFFPVFHTPYSEHIRAPLHSYTQFVVSQLHIRRTIPSPICPLMSFYQVVKRLFTDITAPASSDKVVVSTGMGNGNKTFWISLWKFNTIRDSTSYQKIGTVLDLGRQCTCTSQRHSVTVRLK